MATAEPTYDEFIGQILRPTNLTSLKPPYDSILIQVFRDPTNLEEPSEEFEINTLFPYNTIHDLCTQIYIESGRQEDFQPYHQCILEPRSTDSRPYTHFQYIFNDRAELLMNPFTLMQQARPDPLFVELNGNPLNPKTVSRDAVTLQTALFSKSKTQYILHLFLYNDLLRSFTGARNPIGRADWEGRFRVYFPMVQKEYESGALPDAITSFTPTRVDRFLKRTRLMDQLDEVLQEQPLRRPGEMGRGDPVSLASFRNIRIGWKKPEPNPFFKPFRIDEVFYDMPVSKLIPYIRFFPKATTPISKVYVEGPMNQPGMDEPEILLKWAQEDSLTPQEDLIVAKVLIRPGAGSIHSLYATFFIFQDGSAKFVLQPNADMSNIPRLELLDLGTIISAMTAQVPKQKPKPIAKVPARSFYPVRNAYLDDLYSILNLGLDREDPPITTRSLNSVLPFFGSFFQVTSSPIREQNPIAFLRYKGVDNFQTPSRDFQFLGRVMDLQKLSGKQNAPALVEYYMKEFDVEREVAVKRVDAFFANEAEFILVNPETRTFEQAENPGVDIAIFGKHPFYTFHLYRVSSMEVLRSLKTLLSLLITLEPSQLGDSEATRVVREEDEEEQEEAEQGEERAGGAGEFTMPLMPEAQGGEEGGEFMLDSFGAFDDSEAQEGSSAGLILPQAAASAPAPPSLLALAAEDEAASLPAAPKPQQQAPPAAEEEELEEVLSEKKLKSLASSFYFGSRLTQYDKSLFYYESVNENQYSRMCQSTQSKQPAVVSEEEYQEIRDVYQEDEEAGDILWIEYPLKKGETVSRPKKDDTEVFTVLRYGSTKQNIFLCSRFWCRKDETIVLTKDFFSAKDREGNSKPTKTCPFCKNGLVLDKRKVVKGESVIERVSNKFDKRHTYISFLKKTGHPQGLFLPCCFTTTHHVLDTHDAFKARKGIQEKRVVYQAAAAAAAEKEEEEEGQGEEEQKQAAEPMISITDLSVGSKPIPANYAKKLASATSSYIVGAEKLPLEITPRDGPQIGVLSPALQRFFAQDGSKLVKQDHTVWKLMTDNKTGLVNVSGFFRIAAENRKYFLPDSFLSAVAPFYGLNSAAELKRTIRQVVQPNIFLALNYGNFLFDFYNPQDPNPPTFILKKFALERLGLNLIGVQEEAMRRAWKAYIAFERALVSEEVRKEYRQYGPLFLQNDLVVSPSGGRTNGILFLVLEVNMDGSVIVRCPPYGVSKQQAERCDIGFLTYYPHLGIWEPIFYTDNRPDEEISRTTLLFRREDQGIWPEIVKKRVEEFQTMCASSGMGMYTDSPLVSAKSLIPLSQAVSIPGTDIYGILRDTYNHVSAVLFNIDDTIIVLPCIDDGGIYPQLKVELDWRNFMHRLARGQTVKLFYKIKLKSFFESLDENLQESYAIGDLIRLDQTVLTRSDIYAYQLGNGLFIPIRKPENIAGEILESSRFKEGNEMPWMIDSKLAYGSVEEDEVLTMDHKEFSEIYQHLRLTFSNWLAQATKSLKSDLNTILFKDGDMNMDLPLWEKRQRLLILFGNEVMSWLDSSIPTPGRTPSLKRVDCRLVSEQEECSNACVWREEDKRCLLHVPNEYEVGKANVNARQLLVKRLIEELLRFPEKRNELLTQRVSQYQVLRDGFRSGNQYIIPENIPAWTELLRMEWRKEKKEEPKYLEEMVAIQGPAAEEAPSSAPPPPPSAGVKTPAPAQAARAFKLPPDLDEYLSDKKASLSFVPEEMNMIWPILGGVPGLNLSEFEEATGVDYDIPYFTDVEEALEAAARIKLSIYQIRFDPENLDEPSEIIVKGVYPDKQKAPFLILVELSDGTIGQLTTDTRTLAPIPFDSLPTNIKFKLMKTPATLLS